MRKYLFSILLLQILISCSSGDDKNKNLVQSDFCTQNREIQEEFIDRNGKLIYLPEKDKYAIRYHIPQTIDGLNNYILCEKPRGIVVNDSVLLSGKSYFFNDDENFISDIGGHEYFFFEVSSISDLD